jgi:hypothetical protein
MTSSDPPWFQEQRAPRPFVLRFSSRPRETSIGLGAPGATPVKREPALSAPRAVLARAPPFFDPKAGLTEGSVQAIIATKIDAGPRLRVSAKPRRKQAEKKQSFRASTSIMTAGPSWSTGCAPFRRAGIAAKRTRK